MLILENHVFLTGQLATASDLLAWRATRVTREAGKSCSLRRATKFITREARIIAREGERWITTPTEFSFSQNFT